ncbi:SbmA/BacA-like family transporter [Shigella flexneri]
MVDGEDDATRATPPRYASCLPPCGKLFRLYFHYTYFNIARILYLQVDNVFGLFCCFRQSCTITLGLMTQITNVLVRFAVLSST